MKTLKFLSQRSSRLKIDLTPSGGLTDSGRMGSSTTHPSRRAWCQRSLAVLAATAFAHGEMHAALITPSPLLLATEALPGIDPSGYLVSEKLDGIRAWWDGTRLRHRSGREVSAPAWFVAQLPKAALDGELWLGRGRFEALSSFVRRQNPRDDEWRQVRYMLFELPGAPGTFAQRAQQLRQIVKQHGLAALGTIEQETLSNAAALQARLQDVVRQGGEGLMLHHADATYVSGRSTHLRKLKPLQDAEAVVMGYVAGAGRLTGLMGALQVQNSQGLKFTIGTGFSDAQRANPPPIGSVVTYTYRGTTVYGTPRFASFWRKHQNE
jgi:DNA ligase 1